MIATDDDNLNRHYRTMKSITALQLAMHLEQDDFYSKHINLVMSYLKNRIPHVIYFPDTATVPIDMLHPSEEDGGKFIFNIHKKEDKKINNKSLTRELIEFHEEYRENTHPATGDLNQQQPSLIFIELVVSMILTGLHGDHKGEDYALSMPDEFLEWIDHYHDGNLLRALNEYNIKPRFLGSYCRWEPLPKPYSLYPDSQHNSKSFLKTFNLGGASINDLHKYLNKFYRFKSPSTFPVHSSSSNNSTPDAVTSQNDNESKTSNEEFSPHVSEFILQGDYWRCAFYGQVAHYADSDGMHYIHTLLSSPHKEFSALDLYYSLSKNASKAVDGNKLEDAYRKQLMEFFGNDGYSSLVKEHGDNAIGNIKIIIDECREKISDDIRSGLIDEEEAGNRLKNLKEAYSLYINRNKIPRDSSLKSIQDTVRARIKRSLSAFKESMPAFLDHISHVLSNVDSRLKRSKSYCYRPATKMEWKLN